MLYTLLYTGSNRFSYWSRVTHTSCGYRMMGEGGERERGEVNGGSTAVFEAAEDMEGRGLA